MSALISGLFRFPVKSMGGEAHDSLELTAKGIAGDRAWAVRDSKRGGIRGAKKIPSLMSLNAAFTGEVALSGSSPARITAPDGSTRDTGSADVNEWLSEKLDHPVTLWPLLPEDALDHYRRGAPDHDDLETELRAMFGRTPEEPLPDLTLFAEVLEFESPPGTYFDAFPLLVMTQQSLATMTQRYPDSQFHVDRFRPNILIDTPDDTHPFPEAQWVGKHLHLGDVVLEVVGECPRCSMTTHGFSSLPKDTAVMRALVEANDGCLGVYTKIVDIGTLNVGDTLQVK
ncbi:MAG: MOSC domain-containing protein [Halioglobus sp.]